MYYIRSLDRNYSYRSSRIERSTKFTTLSDIHASTLLLALSNEELSRSNDCVGGAPYTPTSSSAPRMPSTNEGTWTYMGNVNPIYLDRRSLALTKSSEFTKSPNKLLVLANSTAAPTLSTRSSPLPEPSFVGDKRFSLSLPQIVPKNTGSEMMSTLRNRQIGPDVQFGCFQLSAEQMSGEKERNAILRRMNCASKVTLTSKILFKTASTVELRSFSIRFSADRVS